MPLSGQGSLRLARVSEESSTDAVLEGEAFRYRCVTGCGGGCIGGMGVTWVLLRNEGDLVDAIGYLDA